MDIEITFDEVKRETNKAKHGFDFADLTIDFFEAAILRPAKQDRFLAIGWFGASPLTVIFRPLGTEALSVISMRAASNNERKVIK